MKTQRCAIYTRKSSEEGLDQSFNSLDAQREACEAFIKSQAHEGWQPVKKGYDDGGFSGGSMERPGLKALLADIDAGRIDIVVVYKVDRLTRSLADFAKIVDLLDKKGASFVSVTQPFNTTTSMGRLTLNVLLSFAQFEREVTGERIRDKIAASKKKGMWMGGYPCLGYDIGDRALVVNEPEAKVVRRIYERYLILGTVKALAAELNKQGVTSKRWKTRAGKIIGGNSFSRGALYHLLRNRLYVGEIAHSGAAHKGVHDAILPRDLWSRVQARLDEHANERRATRSRVTSHALTGLIYDDRGNRMSPSHATKAGRRYYYYVSQAVLQNRERASGSTKRIPAPAIDQLTMERLRLINLSGDTASTLDNRASLFSSLHQVIVAADRIELIIDAVRLGRPVEEFKHRLPAGDVLDEADGTIRLSIPARLNRRGGRRLIERPNGEPAAAEGFFDLPLMKAIATAHAWRDQLIKGEAKSLRELARRNSCDESRVRHLLPLAFLAPQITSAVFSGKQPRHWTVDRAVRGELPLSWATQKERLGVGG